MCESVCSMRTVDYFPPSIWTPSRYLIRQALPQAKEESSHQPEEFVDGILGRAWYELPWCPGVISFPYMYNKLMARRIRLVLAILLIIVSCAFLVWGLVPETRETLIQPIGPDQMQLPTPTSYFLHPESPGFWLT